VSGGGLALADTKEVLLFLATAGVVVPLFRRLKVSPVIGFLGAGVLLGPHGLGRFPDDSWLGLFQLENTGRIAQIAEFGVVFLLFMIGLELSYERLARLRRLVFGLGAGQVALSAVLIGEIAGMLFGLPRGAALVVGGALALSSTAIVIPVLAERRRLGTAAGRGAFAVLLFQDLMVAPLLFTVSMAGQGGAVRGGADIFWAFAPAMEALALLVLGGRLLLRPLFHQVALARSTEFFMAACLFVVIGAGVASAMSGLSMALGAFIAGLLLGETEYRREIEVTLEPFKGLLLGLFFVSIGAELDLSQVARAPVLVIGLALGLILLKVVVLYPLSRVAGLPAPAAGEMALLLGPGGEFAFVMLTAAVAERLLPEDVGATLILAVTLSMAAIPLLAMLGRARRAPEVAQDDPELAAPPPERQKGRVILVGYGRVGRLVGEMLARHKLDFIAVDDDPKLVKRERRQMRNLYWGDATKPEFLKVCGLEDASGIVVTIDRAQQAERVVEIARKARPDLTIIARARDAHHATRLYALGATDAIPETIEASLQLSEATLVDIGVPMGLVIASIHEKRDEFRKLLQPDGVEHERRAIKLSTRLKDMSRRRESEDGQEPG